MRTAQEWWERVANASSVELRRVIVPDVLIALAELEQQIVGYKEDRVVLVGRIQELEEEILSMQRESA